jgi:hypothetical protein
MKTKLFLFALFAALLSGCTQTSIEVQFFVNNTRSENIVVSYTYYYAHWTEEDGNKKDSVMSKQTIGAGKQEQLFIYDRYWTAGSAESLFARFDVLSQQGDTLLHDAHLQRALWHAEIEHQMLSRYHHHDIEKCILEVQ